MSKAIGTKLNMKKQNSPIIVALDIDSAEQALNLASLLSPELCALKVGKELFTIAGPELVKALIDKGYNVFLDLKYHDIPNTVANACKAATKLGVWMLNVHALGGLRMMQAAREGVDSVAGPKPILIAVTILTSTDDSELAQIGVQGTARDNVLSLAKLSKEAGMDGVVCSAQEASQIREICGQDFCLVTPGVRPRDYGVNDDQRRIMIPVEAINAGSTYLVIGRPITQAQNPRAALEAIYDSITN